MHYIKKIVIGLILGTFLLMIIEPTQRLTVGYVFMIYMWSIGSVYSFRHHVGNLLKMLNPSLKLSIISFFSFKNGFMGSIPILVYVLYWALFGWIYGVVSLACDILSVCRR